MQANEYQEKASGFAVYPKDTALEYLVLGLAAEAGEVSDKLAKSLRGDNYLDSTGLVKEAGDCLWFVSQIAKYFNVPLEDLMQQNIDKLADRQARNKLKGSGDNR